MMSFQKKFEPLMTNIVLSILMKKFC